MGVSRRASVTGFSPGPAMVLDEGRARRSCVWTMRISHVQRSADSGARSFGRVHPRVCLNSRKVCSRSNLRRNACQSRSTSSALASVTEDHSHTGVGTRSPGR